MDAHPAWAVISHYALICPSTDANIGKGSHVVARFATKALADAFVEESYAVVNFDYEDALHFTVEMRPYSEGEDIPKRPVYSMPELICDAYAHQRDLGAPDWAL